MLVGVYENDCDQTIAVVLFFSKQQIAKSHIKILS